MRHVAYDVSGVALLAGWGVVAAAWVAGALAGTRRRGPATASKDRASRVVAAIAIAALLTPASVWQPLTLTSPWIRLASVPVLVCATAFTLWARLRLGRMWSSAAVARPDHELRTDGPYHLTRHPVYTGMLAMLLGSVLAEGAGRWLAIAAAVTVALVCKARNEEATLLRAFPERYVQYRTTVPALVPRPRRRGR